MKAFLLGVVTGAVGLVLAGALLLLTLPGEGSGSPMPSPSPAPSSSAPTTVAAGETWLGALDLSSPDVVTGEGRFTDVTATGHDVTLTPEGLRAGRLEISATLPFADAAAQVDPRMRLSPAPDGRVAMVTTVEVLGRALEVHAVSRVGAENGQLVIEPETVDLGGPDWIDAAASALVRSLVTIRHTVQGVPDGMALTAVQVVPDGFAATLTGTSITLTP